MLSSDVGISSLHELNQDDSHISAAQVDRMLREQRQLLEQILVASTILMRLHINYTIEPQLRVIDAGEREALEAHLQAAEAGKEHWSAATREVVRRTGNCILGELNLLIKAK